MWQSKNEILYKESLELDKAMNQLNLSEKATSKKGVDDAQVIQTNQQTNNNNNSRVNHPLI
jgi:hypothetical protein